MCAQGVQSVYGVLDSVHLYGVCVWGVYGVCMYGV